MRHCSIFIKYLLCFKYHTLLFRREQEHKSFERIKNVVQQPLTKRCFIKRKKKKNRIEEIENILSDPLSFSFTSYQTTSHLLISSSRIAPMPNCDMFHLVYSIFALFQTHVNNVRLKEII